MDWKNYEMRIKTTNKRKGNEMSTKKIYWKVVRNHRGSACVWETNKFYIWYNKGDIIEAPKGTGGFFCFKTRQAARAFKHGLGYGNGHKILRILSLGETRQKNLISGRCTEIDIEHFWSGKLDNTFYARSPNKTVLLSRGMVID